MSRETDSTAAPAPVSPDRLWAEQLAMGMAILVGLLVFMACFHWSLLSSGGKVLGPNYLAAYGWWSAVGVLVHIVLHEAATLFVAWRLKLPLQFRYFGFGANATAVLEYLPRQAWTDALVGFAGPVAGSLFSAALALTYMWTENPFFLGMACVGYFYNLFTLIPILDLEGGWIAAAISPAVWLFGLAAVVLELTKEFNLVLVSLLSFAIPRFVLILRARAPRADLQCTLAQRAIVGLLYFALVLALAWFGSTTFETLASAVPEAMGD